MCIVVTVCCESDRFVFSDARIPGGTCLTFLIRHLLRLSLVVTVPSSIKKTKGYLTKEDADIGSDLFFAEVVKGKVMTDLWLHSYLGVAESRTGAWPNLARVAELRICRLDSTN